MRKRTIKPDFFADDEIASVSPLARILFTGLWCMADRAGRLEDKPRKIKAMILPYDDCDVDELLEELSPEFITRYEVDGERFISIRSFLKHQTPYTKEPPSFIPPPPESPTLAQGSAKVAPTLQQPCTQIQIQEQIQEQIQIPRFDRLWSLLPKSHGSKQTTRARFLKLPLKEQDQCLIAAENLSVYLAAGGSMEFIPLNENFVGGQKARYTEWVNGIPPRYKTVSRDGFTPEQIATGSYRADVPLGIGDGT